MKRIMPKDLARELIAFVLTVICAIAFRWEAKDLIWSLWTSSLCVGYCFIVVTIAASVLSADQPGQLGVFAFFGLLMLAFFTFHFGMFHFVHGVFLHHFFPLDPAEEGSFPNMAMVFVTCLSLYWPVVLATFISRLPDFKSAGLTADILSSHRGKGGDPFLKPYANVIRMHILIFVFAGLAAFHVSRYAIFPVIAFYFFPWGMVFGKKAATEQPPAS